MAHEETAAFCGETCLSANDTESQFVGQSVTHFFAEHPSSLVATVTDSTFTSAELFFSTGVAMQGG